MYLQFYFDLSLTVIVVGFKLQDINNLILSSLFKQNVSVCSGLSDRHEWKMSQGLLKCLNETERHIVFQQISLTCFNTWFLLLL